MGTLSVTELNSFNGGVNNVTAPYLIRKDESTLLINVDLRKGAMWSVPQPIFHSNIYSAYFYQFKDTLYTYGSWRSNVLWDNKWYWSDGATIGKVLADGTEKPLGLITPINKPVGTPKNEGPHTGDFKYCYTFYDSITGVESAPSPLSQYITVSSNNVEITNMYALNGDYDSVRLYRIGGYLPYFMLVDTISVTPGNGLGPYLDDIDDTQIDGRILQTLRNGTPPNGINYFIEMNGRMYGATDNLVYYSALGNPDSWYIYDMIPCQDTIKGLAKSPGGLLIMGDTWTNLLKGSGPENFVLKVVSDKIGIVDAMSLAYIDQTAVWLSNHGFVTSDGYTIKQLTVDKIDNIGGMLPSGAQSLNNVYYMAFKPMLFPSNNLYPSNDLFPNSVAGTGGVDQGIVTIDFKRGNGYAYKILDYSDINYLDKFNGEIAIIHGDPTETLFQNCDALAFEHCIDFFPCSGWELSYINKWSNESLTKLSKLSELDYISPLMIDGTTATLKEYDKVRIIFKGIFKFQVLFDNDRLISEILISSYEEWVYEERMIGIPNEDNKAYSIRFRIAGRGVIKGIQYTYKMRELP